MSFTPDPEAHSEPDFQSPNWNSDFFNSPLEGQQHSLSQFLSDSHALFGAQSIPSPFLGDSQALHDQDTEMPVVRHDSGAAEPSMLQSESNNPGSNIIKSETEEQAPSQILSISFTNTKDSPIVIDDDDFQIIGSSTVFEEEEEGAQREAGLRCSKWRRRHAV